MEAAATTSTATIHSIKCDLKGELRRWSPAQPITLRSLETEARENFVVAGSEGVSLQWIDSDGDPIALDRAVDLENAISEATRGGKGVLRIRLTRLSADAASGPVARRLAEYKALLKERTHYHFGYPYNLSYDHKEVYEFMHYSINNLGDPFVESNYGVHSREFEIEVLNFFSDLWRLPRAEMWGYVTACGTEGNLHGILVGRENHPDAVLYASQDSHYSVFKACKMFRIEHERIASDKFGELDYAAFAEALRRHPGRDVIVVANIGTTVRGAVDSLGEILKALKDAGVPEEKFHIHCDGALYALMLPFMTEYEQVDFTLPIASMCVSGHKFLGCPMPCGVTIVRKRHMAKMTKMVEYLNSVDTTIMGSRNGHAPIFLWYSLRTGGVEDLERRTRVCHANALLLYTMLRDAGIGVLLNPKSTTVVLERPPPPFVRRWQLACEKDIAHVVVMPNVTSEKIVTFVAEYLAAVRPGSRLPCAPRLALSPTTARPTLTLPSPAAPEHSAKSELPAGSPTAAAAGAGAEGAFPKKE